MIKNIFLSVAGIVLLAMWGVAEFSHAAGVPLRLAVPRLHIDAPVEEVGLTGSGAMDVPSSWDAAGWYRYGPRPGEDGNAVIDGHLDSFTGPAVFWELRNVRVNDDVNVLDTHGHLLHFVITRIEKLQDDNPSASADVFHPEALGAHLVLVTCIGSWDKNAQRYSQRLAAFADLLSDSSAESSSF